ncbi:platelet glycoprotein Ib alpha chain [Ranitomeya imitator]|uniref:platelet glycoprotein Ib alpha chain n=1 Tax=Ranitomeya imitator TaxID=111125 RepID=UPI0037E8818A
MKFLFHFGFFGLIIVSKVFSKPSCSSEKNSKNMEETSCTNLGLSVLPVTDIPKNTAVLLLSYNNFKSLSTSMFKGFKDLIELEVTDNGMTNFDVDIALMIEELNLANNSLTKLPKVSLLSALTKLHLSHNQISTIQENAFTGLKSLTMLELQHNQINSLSEEVFMALPSLNHLDLSYNQLWHLPDRLLSSSENLVILYLSGNQLTDIPDNFFDDLDLGYVYLEKNPWNCNCALLYFKNWLEADEDRVYETSKEGPTKNQRSVICSDGTPLIDYSMDHCLIRTKGDTNVPPLTEKNFVPKKVVETELMAITLWTTAPVVTIKKEITTPTTKETTTLPTTTPTTQETTTLPTTTPTTQETTIFPTTTPTTQETIIFPTTKPTTQETTTLPTTTPTTQETTTLPTTTPTTQETTTLLTTTPTTQETTIFPTTTPTTQETIIFPTTKPTTQETTTLPTTTPTTQETTTLLTTTQTTQETIIFPTIKPTTQETTTLPTTTPTTQETTIFPTTKPTTQETTFTTTPTTQETTIFPNITPTTETIILESTWLTSLKATEKATTALNPTTLMMTTVVVEILTKEPSTLIGSTSDEIEKISMISPTTDPMLPPRISQVVAFGVDWLANVILEYCCLVHVIIYGLCILLLLVEMVVTMMCLLWIYCCNQDLLQWLPRIRLIRYSVRVPMNDEDILLVNNGAIESHFRDQSMDGVTKMLVLESHTRQQEIRYTSAIL